MLKIPILRKGKKPCPKYIYALEHALGADGCTAVSEIYHCCCIIHDLAYKLGIDCYGNPIDRAQADFNFRSCMQDKSMFGKCSPMSWWRWAGVRCFGSKHYHKTVPQFKTYLF